MGRASSAPGFDRPERADRFADRGERPGASVSEGTHRARIRAGHATYRIEVGYQHGVKPGNIVGAIANEGGIDSKNIGRIEIYDDYAVLDMPDTLSREALEMMAGIRVAGPALRISVDGEGAPAPAPAPALRCRKPPSRPARRWSR
jgi:ATP-dependent RNA helicase DeaD